MAGSLSGLRILDLSRILAGPTCTQMLGDLGAEVIKIENPATGGDDTRSWGPPFAEGSDGQPTDLSAYFMCANRNKLSVAMDITTADGQAAVKAIAAECDVVVENFKPGGLAKYGLDAESLMALDSRLVYCSISGFGQTGPNAHKPGYDLMAQGYGGIMSLTGVPDGEPMKVGVGIADVMCGMYATIGILAALRHRDETGEGQHIDVALVDTQIAWLINEGLNFLTTGKTPERRGNSHPNIVPYQVFEATDGHVIVAIGNDSQFQRFCDFLGLVDLPEDPRYATNPARLEHRDDLLEILVPAIRELAAADVLAGLEACRVPVGPVQDLEQVFGSNQVKARDMVARIPSQNLASGEVHVIGNPIKMSRTPVTYRSPPPSFGADTDHVLQRFLPEDKNSGR